jgi:hypothetical protein
MRAELQHRSMKVGLLEVVYAPSRGLIWLVTVKLRGMLQPLSFAPAAAFTRQ